MKYSSNILPDHAIAIERSTLSDLSLSLINTYHIYILSYGLPCYEWNIGYGLFLYQ